MALFRYLNALFWRHWLRRRGVKFSGDLHTLRKKAVLQVEEGVTIARVRLESRALSVGAQTYIRSGSELYNVSRIGRFCSIGNGVILGQDKAAHPLDWVSTHPFQFTDSNFPYEGGIAPAELGHDVWIGRDAMVMEGVKVGTGGGNRYASGSHPRCTTLRHRRWRAGAGYQVPALARADC